MAQRPTATVSPVTKQELFILFQHFMRSPSFFREARLTFRSHLLDPVGEAGFQVLWNVLCQVHDRYPAEEYNSRLVTYLASRYLQNSADDLSPEMVNLLTRYEPGGVIFDAFHLPSDQFSLPVARDILRRFLYERSIAAPFRRVAANVSASGYPDNLGELVQLLAEQHRRNTSVAATPVVASVIPMEGDPRAAFVFHPVGIPFIDEVVHGHCEGSVYGILGTTGSGKTTMCCQIAASTARRSWVEARTNGGPVPLTVYFTAEQPARELRPLIQSYIMRIPRAKLMTFTDYRCLTTRDCLAEYERHLQQDVNEPVGELERWQANAPMLEQGLVLVDFSQGEDFPDAGEGGIDEIVSVLERILEMRQQPLRCVVIDWVGCLIDRHVMATGRDENAYRHLLGHFVDVAKSKIAARFRCTVWAAQQLAGRAKSFAPTKLIGEEPVFHEIQVLAALHPAAVYRRRELYETFADQLRLFTKLVRGESAGRSEAALCHVDVYKASHLRRIVDEILADPDPLRRIIAVDAEWHGERPEEPGAYLRTIQFSTRHGEGINVVLRHRGGEVAFQPSIEAAVAELSRLLTAHDGWVPRVGGHFFRADLPWLLHAGLDVRPWYAPAESPERCRYEGGWDTSLMYHAVCETASFKLEDIAIKLTSVPRYDVPIHAARREYCRQHNLKESDLEGYGFMYDWVLHPYGCFDADATRRIAIRCMEPGGLLDKDSYGNASWVPYWIAHRASLAFLEMELNGIAVDWARIDQLAARYMEAYEKLLASFREEIRWPDFNPKSAPQCTVFLFGDAFGRKRGGASIRPDGALTLGLTPIKTTGRRSKLWSDVVERGEAAKYSPSTDKETLGILGQRQPLVRKLRDLKFVGQVLQSVLRRPEVDEETEEWELEDGHGVYSAGLPGSVMSDGRIHTHLYQTKETGRASSARPPLQNLSSRREADYRRILGYVKDGKPAGDYLDVFGAPQYLFPLRSILRASPGWVLVEADLIGAELAVIAWASGDRTMIEHVRRNMLPEDHPDFYDIHSHTTVRAFRLDCEPTKKGLAAIGKSHLRVGAKAVNFGVPYGRGAAAIERQCREEGAEITIDDAQRLIDGYFEQYPATATFLEECRKRSQDPGWLCNFFGRYRRFVRSNDPSVIGEQERQAMNYPIQSAVADAVSVALYNMLQYRKTHPDVTFRLLLQIHDAVLVECPASHLAAVKQMFVDCMSYGVPIWPRRLDGSPMPVNEPYHFGVDIKAYLNWGEKLTAEKAKEAGIDPELL